MSGGQTRLFSGGTPRLRPEGKEEEPAVSSAGNSILGRGNSRCKGLGGGAGGRAVREMVSRRQVSERRVQGVLVVEAALLQAGNQEPLVEFIPSPKA